MLNSQLAICRDQNWAFDEALLFEKTVCHLMADWLHWEGGDSDSSLKETVIHLYQNWWLIWLWACLPGPRCLCQHHNSIYGILIYLPVHPKGNQPWMFIERTDGEAEIPVIWPPDVNNWLMGKVPDAGKDWRHDEKEKAEDGMVGYHWPSGQEFKQSPGNSGGQRSLACCTAWGYRVRHNLATEQQQYIDMISLIIMAQIKESILWQKRNNELVTWGPCVFTVGHICIRWILLH